MKTNENNKPLSVKQLKFIELKTTTDLSLTDIYKECDIKDINTYQRWLKNDLFSEELMKASRKRLNHAVPKAISTLIRLMDSDKENIALKAAETILQRADATREDIEKAMTIKVKLGDDE